MWIECRKIWHKKRVWSVLLVLFIFQIGLFMYSIEQKKTQWEMWNASAYETEYIRVEKEYVSAFHDNMQDIVSQADFMGTISIFSQTDSFSNRNLLQTEEDFIDLLDITPMVIESPFLKEFFLNDMIHFVVVAVGIGMAYILIEEKKQGLRAMLFSTPNGRGNFVLYKVLALFVSTGIVTILFYGGFLVASSILFDGNLWECWGYPVQSLSVFGKLSWNINMGNFLLVYILGQWMVVFWIAFFVWMLLFCIDNLLISVGMAGMAGMLSYIVYSFIESGHALEILRFCNPCYLVCGNAIFTEYRNMNLFSQVVNKNVVIGIWMLITLVAMLLLSFYIGKNRYPCEASKGKMEHRVWLLLQNYKNWKNKHMGNLSLTGMEYYKVLISQKGILILLLIIMVFIYQADFTEIQFSGSQKMYFSFLERHEGVSNETSKAEIQELELILAEVENTYLLSQKQYEAGEISLNESIEKSLWYQGYEQERFFLKQIKEQTEYLEQLKEYGIEGSYVNLYAYNKLFDEESIFVNMLLCFGVVLLSSGIINIENKFGMNSLIRSSVTGQRAIFMKKTHVAVVLAFVLYIILAGIEFASVYYMYDLSSWDAPVQSIMSFSDFSIRCSIGMFFVMRLLGKGIVLMSLAGITCVVNIKYKKRMRKI